MQNQALQVVCGWHLGAPGRSSFETWEAHRGSSASFAASHQGCRTFQEEVHPYCLLHHHQNEEAHRHIFLWKKRKRKKDATYKKKEKKKTKYPFVKITINCSAIPIEIFLRMQNETLQLFK